LSVLAALRAAKSPFEQYPAYQDDDFQDPPQLVTLLNAVGAALILAIEIGWLCRC
jgi:hypothetical protein